MIEVMKQAVVYFEHMVRTLKLRDQSEPAQLLFKLRQAIEQAEKQEPFAWCIESEDSADWCFAKTEEGVKSNSVLMDEDCIKTKPFPLYTTPPAAQRQPLTDEQIEKGRSHIFSVNNPYCPCDSKTMRKAVRWAEAAHGIGEKK